MSKAHRWVARQSRVHFSSNNKEQCWQTRNKNPAHSLAIFHRQIPFANFELAVHVAVSSCCCPFAEHFYSACYYFEPRARHADLCTTVLAPDCADGNYSDGRVGEVRGHSALGWVTGHREDDGHAAADNRIAELKARH